MGQVQSYEGNADDEETKEECNGDDDLTVVTRSTSALSAMRSHDSASRSSSSSRSSRSSRSSVMNEATSSTKTSRCRRKEKKSRGSKSRQSQTVDPFGLHGIAIESMDTASLPGLIGSMISNSSRSTTTTAATLGIKPTNHGYSNLGTLPEVTVQPSPPLIAQPRFQTTSMIHFDYRTMEHLVRQEEGESLPAPNHETEKKIYHYVRKTYATANKSHPVPMGASGPRSYNSPIDCVAQSAKETEFLSRLYDLRTWNMYKRITEARQDQNYYSTEVTARRPLTTVQIPSGRQEKALDLPADPMIFALDME